MLSLELLKVHIKLLNWHILYNIIWQTKLCQKKYHVLRIRSISKKMFLDIILCMEKNYYLRLTLGHTMVFIVAVVLIVIVVLILILSLLSSLLLLLFIVIIIVVVVAVVVVIITGSSSGATCKNILFLLRRCFLNPPEKSTAIQGYSACMLWSTIHVGCHR